MIFADCPNKWSEANLNGCLNGQVEVRRWDRDGQVVPSLRWVDCPVCEGRGKVPSIQFKRFTFSWSSPLLGLHVGRNPVSGQRFAHLAPVPFFGIDFNLPPYGLNDAARERLETMS